LLRWPGDSAFTGHQEHAHASSVTARPWSRQVFTGERFSTRAYGIQVIGADATTSSCWSGGALDLDDGSPRSSR
jgi:hypothetical protein